MNSSNNRSITNISEWREYKLQVDEILTPFFDGFR